MLSKWEELRLIAQCVATDNRHAFGLLVEEYNDQLRRFLFNLTLGNATLTDDLAQETFLKAYLSIRSFKGLSRFKTWLYRIAYNEYYNYTRKYSDIQPTYEPPPESESSDAVNASDARLDVEECLKYLNDVERMIVLLFYLEDQPIKKIVEVTQLPEGTIKSHLHRAKNKMAKVFNSYER